MKQIIKHAVAKAVGKNIHIQPVALKMPCCQTWSGQADKNIQGRTNFFNTIAYPRIKNFGGTIFFLTGPPSMVLRYSAVATIPES